VPIQGSYFVLRDEAQRRWERRYLEALMAAHGGNVDQARRASGVGRTYMYELLRRHGLGERKK
jgi:DNA-binding NtrC family response regulator